MTIASCHFSEWQYQAVTWPSDNTKLSLDWGRWEGGYLPVTVSNEWLTLTGCTQRQRAEQRNFQETSNTTEQPHSHHQNQNLLSSTTPFEGHEVILDVFRDISKRRPFYESFLLQPIGHSWTSRTRINQSSIMCVCVCVCVCVCMCTCRVCYFGDI